MRLCYTNLHQIFTESIHCNSISILHLFALMSHSASPAVSCLISEGDTAVAYSAELKRYHTLQLRAGTCVRLWKYKVRTEGAIGHYYGSRFVIRGGSLELFDPTKLEVKVEEHLTGDATNDNRDLLDAASNQKFTSGEIEELKESELAGEQLISEIVSGSSTFSNKSEFSQLKYISRKKAKHLPVIYIYRPSLRHLAPMHYHLRPEKIGFLRLDTISQLLSLANVRYGSRLLVVDNFGGLIIGGVLERMGGGGNIVELFTTEIVHPRPVMATFSHLSPLHWSCLSAFPLRQLSSLRDSISQDVQQPSLRDSISQDVQQSSLRDSISQDVQQSSLRDSISQDVQQSSLRDSISQDVQQSSLRDPISQDVQQSSLRNSISQDVEQPSLRDSISQDVQQSSLRDSISQDVQQSSLRDSISQDVQQSSLRDSISQDVQQSSLRDPISQDVQQSSLRDSISQDGSLPLQQEPTQSTALSCMDVEPVQSGSDTAAVTYPQPSNTRYASARDLLLEGGFEGIILASKHNPVPILEACLPFICPSSPLLVYCVFPELIALCNEYFHQSRSIILKNLSTSWLRAYQPLESKLHPEMMSNNCRTGYLLYGVRVKTYTDPPAPLRAPVRAEGSGSPRSKKAKLL